MSLEPGRPVVMGILNASPESFSDGTLAGRDLEAQVARGLGLAEAGAAIVDVGGESGVTHRPPLSVAEEVRRVVPLVERLTAAGVLVSIDTYKPAVARAALSVGASLVNDVSGLRDPALAELCAESGAGLVVMHTRALPKQKAFPHYGDVVADVHRFLRDRTAAAISRGVALEQIVLDPGPDFAKTPAQTIAVLRHLNTLTTLGRPLLLAVSRKDFLGALTGRTPAARLAGTLAALGAGVDAGAAILRVHDVAAAGDFLAVRAALGGAVEVPSNLRLEPSLRREAA